jgi:hypothetical protein
MSLDIYLYGKEITEKCTCDCCGHIHNRTHKPLVYNDNITHNLLGMACEAGIGDALWSPEKIGITKAGELIPLLQDGLNRLIAKPKHYKQFNANNGWGIYEQFIPFVENYLKACKENPDAEVLADR